MTKNRWLIALLALPMMGSPISVQLSTSALLGTSGKLAFDFTDGGPPANSAQISAFVTNGTLGAFSTTGSVTGTLASTVTLSDSAFFSELLQTETLGTSLSFLLNQTTAPPLPGSSPDEFSFFLLNAAGTDSLITTTDPTGANALFVVDSSGGSTGAITVYTSTQVRATVSPVTGAAPEPSSLLLFVIGSASFVAIRRRSSSRRSRWTARARRWVERACVLTGGALMVLPLAMAQNYSFVKIVDYGTPRPDGQASGKFSAYGWPVTDGTSVAWLESNFVNGFWDSMWSSAIGSNTFTKLVDTSTAAPGGTGNFTAFSGAGATGNTLEMSQGRVLFAAIDSKASLPNDGLFTVPAAGGAVSLIANYTTAGGEFTGFGLSAGNPSRSIVGTQVAFDANTANGYGIFSTTLGSSSIATVAIGSSPCHPEFIFPVIIFAGAATDGNNTVYYGQNVFDPSLGYDALYLNTCAGEILTVNTPLPGNPNSNQHTRFLPNLIRMSNGVIAFVADDANSSGASYYRGIFTYGPGGLQKVVSSLDFLPGLGPLVGTSSFNGISLSNGAIAFRASDISTDALYVAVGGSITRVIGFGDPLDGAHLTGGSGSSLLDLTPNALAPNGTLVFTAGLDSGKTDGIFAAVPNCAADVSGQVAVTLSGFRLNRANQQYVQTVTLTNTGSSTITAPLSLALTNLTNGTLTNASGATTCALPSGRPYVNLGSGVLSPGASVSGTLSFSDPSNLGILYTTSVLGGGLLPR